MDGSAGSRLMGVKVVLEQRYVGGCTCLLCVCYICIEDGAHGELVNNLE